MTRQKQLTDEEIAQRGREWYEQHLRATLEPAHRDEFVAIEIETGEYFLGAAELEALEAAHRRRPGGTFYLARVGHPAAGRLLSCR